MCGGISLTDSNQLIDEGYEVLFSFSQFTSGGFGTWLFELLESESVTGLNRWFSYLLGSNFSNRLFYPLFVLVTEYPEILELFVLCNF